MADFALTTFNTIRNEDAILLARLPAATKTNLGTIKAILDADPEAYNAYVSAMVVRIGRTYMDVPRFTNPLAKFKKGENPMAHLVQDLHFDPITAGNGTNQTGDGQFDPTGVAFGGPLSRKDDENVHVAYYQQNFQPFYKVSVDRVGMMNALRSWEDLNRFWGAKMQAMYTGADIDEYVAMRKVINDAIAVEGTGAIPKAYIGDFAAKDDDSGKALSQAIKILLADLAFPHQYNIAGVTNVNKPSDFTLLLNKSVAPNLDVYTLASLFNPELVEIPRRITTIDTFSTLETTGTNPNENVLALLCTTEFFKFFETMRTVRPIENPQGLFTNFYLHRWETLQLSPFETAVAIVGADE